MARRPPPNRYPGNCRTCGGPVAIGAGFLAGKLDGRWSVQCSTCATGAPPVPVTAPPIDYDLTAEQQAAVDAFREGVDLCVQAGAGTGKTSLLLAIGSSTTRPGQYLAFNSAIVSDAAAKFAVAAPNVRCSTIHSLAHQGTGRVFGARLKGSRCSLSQLARELGLNKPFIAPLADGKVRVLQPAKLARLVLSAITLFCESDADVPDEAYVPVVDGLDEVDPVTGRRSRVNHGQLAKFLRPYLAEAWADLSDPHGTLQPGGSFFHSVYVKVFALSENPVIPGDFVLVDEAQDLNPVLIQILSKQVGKQLVIVGDSQQSIYGWRGAVDALDRVPTERTTYLTHSFRFGPEIAGVANAILAEIPNAELRLIGKGGPSNIDVVTDPSCILTRTNAGALDAVLAALDDGRKVYLGGGTQVLTKFCRGAADLIAGRPSTHPDLIAFANWNELVEYIEDDPGDLGLLVRLVKRYGTDTLLSALSEVVQDETVPHDVTVTTAHKAKGCQWDTVRIAPDFSPEASSPADLRLLYVAVTRAKHTLDISQCEAVKEILSNHYDG